MKTKQIDRPEREAVKVVSDAAKRAAAESRVPRILFVCLGNICRSPAAQGITQQMASRRGIAVDCDSAGFYGGHAGELPDTRMRQAAWQRGYKLDHRSRPIRPYDLDDFDIVFGMDDYNIRDLYRLAETEEREKKILRMTDFAVKYPQFEAVPDPYYEGAEGFQLVLDLLEDACCNLLDTIESQIKK